MPDPILQPAIFLDRDGVLNADVDLISQASQLRVMSGVAEALIKLQAAGFQFVVVTNQAVIARGLASETEIHAINRELAHQIMKLGGPELKNFYVCPHHPKANLPAYRQDCDCRKPSPGMLLKAARDLHLDLARSFMIGDRITDIIAGKSAGCRTIWVEAGKHTEAAIESNSTIDKNIKPDWTCAGLPEAAQWILSLK